ncbi:MAG: HD domain-containing protein [Solirubrobacteraceae bacterium]|nr:HD domain-containing protein [Solirubrobacteraceae bacterium]
MLSPHPDHATEQRYLENACDAHDAKLADLRGIVEGRQNGGGDQAAQRALRNNAMDALSRLEAVDDQRLIFGRLDFEKRRKKTVYIGPCTVQDPSDASVLVVDFTRPVAKAFYTADEQDPHDLLRRRTFEVVGRQLLGIDDEVFGEAADAATGTPTARRDALDRVAAELERAREPRMQAMVATIVADQYRLIEEPREGVLVVQGGPGTGKTAVALHRAVYLVRNHEDLGRVLVVGPNAAFMAYIADVVPGLGEDSVDQIAIDRLPETGDAQGRGYDEPAVAALKGDARMAEVLARAVTARTRPADGSHMVTAQGVTIRVTAEAADAVLEREVARNRPYAEGRRQFIEAMRSEVERLLQARFARNFRRRSVDVAGLRRSLSTDRPWNNFLERMWPATSAAQIVHEVLTTESRLQAASAGILSETEVSQLVRRGVRTVGGHPWTRDDLPLIDEVHARLQGGVNSYGYVIVDEAQDLTPMQLRMIARRSSNGDLTLVGDIAQATGPTSYRDWDEITTHLPQDRGVRLGRLTIGYRVPRAVMELANAVLPVIAPGLSPTEPVRETPIEPRFRQVHELDLADAVAAEVGTLVVDDRSVGVIVPQSLLVAVRGALAATGVSVGDISTDQLEKRVTLLSGAEAKGLEFDRVVLVEPRRIVTDSSAGWRELYIALSRATQQIIVVHAQALPAPLPGGDPVVEGYGDGTADASGSDARQTGGVTEADESAEAGDFDLDLDLDLDLEPDLDPSPAPVVASTSTKAGEQATTPTSASDGSLELPDAAGQDEYASVVPAADSGGGVREFDVGSVDVEVGSVVASGDAAEAKRAAVEALITALHGLRCKRVTESVGNGDLVGWSARGAVGLVDDTPSAMPVGGRVVVRDRSKRPVDSTLIGGSFTEALVYAKLQHQGRTRRGTAIPYLGHLLATAALVLEDGGTENEAIAALLHDAVEDGLPDTAEAIRRQFGDAVASVVIGCTDPVEFVDFRARKSEHLRLIEAGSTSVRRVALAEKLDNARALLRDLRRYGSATWDRMGIERDEMLWYLRELVTLFARSFPSVLAEELRRTVDEIEHYG